MEILPTRISMIAILLCFFLTILPSCTKSSDLLVDENLVETSVEQTTLTETTTDSVVADTPLVEENKITSRTKLSITGNQFYINDQLTYKDRYWQDNKIEGLLMNSRMVQGIFDDSNSATQQQFAYPDSNTWDAERNTNEFIAAMAEWKSKGLLAFTLNLQGGSPTGYGNSQPWVNSAFDSKGNLKPTYLNRLERVLNKADELNMVVILGYFYFGQDQELEDEAAVIKAVDNITYWLLENGYENLLIEINNECNHQTYDHDILRANRVHELIKRVKETQSGGKRLFVSTSYTGGMIPGDKVLQESDYIILHGNGVSSPSALRNLIVNTKSAMDGQNKPIIINEDDHFDFDQADYNLLASVEGYVSWGYFDFRKQGEGYEDGFQSVPVDWSINSDRKNSFFNKLAEITGF